MNNNSNNYLLNQNTQQQYNNPQSFETFAGQNQKMGFFIYQREFQNSQQRADFVQNMYTYLIIEFIFNLGMVALGFYTRMGFWFVRLHEDEYDGEIYYFGVTPSWLFYVSLCFSLIIQFTLYFGGNEVRKAPQIYIIFILQLVFFGFTFTTICMFMAKSLWIQSVWQTWGIILIIIGSFKMLGIVNKKEISLLSGVIIILGLSITISLILIFIRFWFIWEKIVSGIIVTFYGFYLLLETGLLMSKGRLNLQPDEYLIGSMLLNGLIFQPLVRLCEIFCGNRNQ